MIDRRRFIRGFGQLCNALLLMIAGAWLLTIYLAFAHPDIEQLLETARSTLSMAFYILLLLASAVRSREETYRAREPSARWSGASVVLATGLFGAYFVASESVFVAAAIIAGTLAAALLVWRFATIHAAEIGEARFADTDYAKS